MPRVAAVTLVRARALRRKLTDAEAILWSRLRGDNCGLRFRRQHPVGPYVADFACLGARLIVEVDGATHSTESERRHDARRDAFLRARAWDIVRVTNEDVYRTLEDVLECIHRRCRERG